MCETTPFFFIIIIIFTLPAQAGLLVVVVVVVVTGAGMHSLVRAFGAFKHAQDRATCVHPNDAQFKKTTITNVNTF
jgi:hypothetical protein